MHIRRSFNHVSIRSSLFHLSHDVKKVAGTAAVHLLELDTLRIIMSIYLQHVHVCDNCGLTC